MKVFRRFVDNSKSTSLASSLRRIRFQFFISLLNTVPRPVRILDLGGTRSFWEMMTFDNERDVEITLLNVDAYQLGESSSKEKASTKFLFHTGDACSMPEFSDGEFDVVFSNSVIEHVGDFNAQKKMATEIKRVGKRYFVQTPNFYFPIEPHFIFPCFQFFPVSLRALLLHNFSLGWTERVSDYNQSKAIVGGIKLLTADQLKSLFPEAKLYRERFFGLTKSLIVYGGW